MNVSVKMGQPPSWLVQQEAQQKQLRLFLDDQRFHDDVHGTFYLNRLERDAVDTPQFQRLFRLGQLGFIDHVFQAANHTRGAHSLATCAIAKSLVTTINMNTARVERERLHHVDKARSNTSATPLFPASTLEAPAFQISFTSRLLIGLAALLHDISHGPFSHDLEKKTHKLIEPHVREGQPSRVLSHFGPYPKHDDYEENPALYLMVLDPTQSILARVLRAYSPLFWDLMKAEAAESAGTFELGDFAEALATDRVRTKWPKAKEELLPTLIFHLLAFEQNEGQVPATIRVKTDFNGGTVQWGLGPVDVREELHDAFYQPYRHDIVGNTVSADLIDYLHRDIRRLGLQREPDLRMLDYYVVVQDTEGRGKQRCRCAIDLNDYKRGTPRLDVVNDIFRLLDLRFEIHEKAVFHRVVQSSIAMLARAIYLLPPNDRPAPREFYGFGEGSPALAGDDALLEGLLRIPALRDDNSLAFRLAERRVYRPSMVVPGDRIHSLLHGLTTHSEKWSVPADLRLLAALLDSAYYAPFICLVAWLIEMRLKHAFTGDEDVRNYIQEVMGDEAALAVSMTHKPSRVIIWALPYKQLHKVPAVWVRITHCDGTPKDEVGSLDTLQERLRDASSGDLESLRERVVAGIDDAESKYASLWKLFVFLSDGLFSTGLLGRLQGDVGCGAHGNAEGHRECLSEAMGLVVEGIRAVWAHWEAIGTAGPTRLAEPCPPGEFAKLLLFLAPRQAHREIADFAKDARAVSAVAVDQYLHLAGTTDDVFGAPEACRDSRFKFQLSLGDEIESVLAGVTFSEDERTFCRNVVKAYPDSMWTTSDLVELGQQVRGQPPEILQEALQTIEANRSGRDITALEKVWRRDSMIFGGPSG